MLTKLACEWFPLTRAAEALADDRTTWMRTFFVFASLALIAFGLGARTWAKPDASDERLDQETPCDKR